VANAVISGIGANRVTLKGLTISYGVNYGVYIESGTDVIFDGLIVNNTVTGIRNAFGSLTVASSVTSWGIYTSNSGAVVCTSGTMTLNSPYGIAVQQNSTGSFSSACTISISGGIISGISVAYNSYIANNATTTITSTAASLGGSGVSASASSQYLHSTNSFTLTASGSGDWSTGVNSSYNSYVSFNMPSGKTLSLSTTATASTQYGLYAAYAGTIVVAGAGNVATSSNFDYDAYATIRGGVNLGSTGTAPATLTMSAYYNSTFSTSGSWTTNATCDASSSCW